jgi:tRNA A37 threonylcarbamoyladenosine dehydratase
MEQKFDFVVDAIDTLAPKVFLLYYAVQNKQNIVSCMGAGGKFDPTKIEIADIAKSYNCRLAFYIRKRLHRLGIREGITVVFSPEKVAESAVSIEEQTENKIATVGTISYMPAIFGCFCASHVINRILEL